jgi:trans-2,3-dihydro-3-hydroxyanthranilate isomerase
MQLTYYTLDVFTDRRLAGNPLAVVTDGAEHLDTAAMQAVAREFNLSETVFVLPTEKPAHSAKVRIFTPARELPFAGHPTIGTAILLAELRASASDEALIVLDQQIGTVRVGVRLRGGAPYAEFDAPKVPVEAGLLPPSERLAAGLGLLPSEIGFENHKPSCFAAGNAFAFVPVTSLDAIARAAPQMPHWTQAFEEQGLIGVFVYTRQCQHNTSSFHARMFAPSSGVPEDPATGSAAVCFAGVVKHFDTLPDGMHRRVIEQGYEMNRPSEITVTIDVGQGKLHNVRIGGHAVRVAEGRLTI